MIRLCRSMFVAAMAGGFIAAVPGAAWSQENPPPQTPPQANPSPEKPPQEKPSQEKPAQEKPPTDARNRGARDTRAPFRKIVFSGNEMVMSVFNTLGADCIAAFRPDVRIVTPPANGSVRYDGIIAAVERPPGDPREKCNGRRTISVGIFYKSRPGFVGADAVVIDVDFKQGFVGRFGYDIEVR